MSWWGSLEVKYFFFTRWWFQTFFIVTPIPGEMIQFDELIFFKGVFQPPTSLFSTIYPKSKMEPKNRPIEKENHLPSASILEFHVNFLGCISKIQFGGICHPEHPRKAHGFCALCADTGVHHVRTNRYHGFSINPKKARLLKPLVIQGFSHFFKGCFK